MSEWRTGPDNADLRAAEQVSPDAVRSYLASSGWHPGEAMNRAAIWTLVDGRDEFEILLPLDRRLRDFPIRMFDLLRTLAIIEDRSVASILGDLASTDTDTMTFRLLPGGPPGTIGLFGGMDAVAGIRELVLTSAYASVLDRPLLVQGRRPGPVREFAQQVRLGTPQSGSWVISTQMRLPDVAERTSAGLPEPRRVSLQMHRTVRATLMAAGEALRDHDGRRDLEPFLRRAPEGVSANACEALALLGRDESPFEVRFAWASRSPVQVGAGRFRFDRPVIALLKETGERLRNTLPEGAVVVRGIVSKLRRERSGSTGDVVVTGVVESEHGRAEHKVTVRMQPHLYSIAVGAHDRGVPIRIRGYITSGRMDVVHDIEVEHGRNGP